MREEKLDEIVLEQLGLPLNSEPDLESWKKFLYKLKNYSKEVTDRFRRKYDDYTMPINRLSKLSSMPEQSMTVK